jgi:hypothetical protein
MALRAALMEMINSTLLKLAMPPDLTSDTGYILTLHDMPFIASCNLGPACQRATVCKQIILWIMIGASRVSIFSLTKSNLQMQFSRLNNLLSGGDQVALRILFDKDN